MREQDAPDPQMPDTTDDLLPPPDLLAMARLKQKAPEAADLLRQLANPTRLLILCHITHGERAVGEMERDLGLKQPGLSQQLAELRQAGLVKTRRESRSIYYSIADDRVQGIMGMLHDIFCAVSQDEDQPA